MATVQQPIIYGESLEFEEILDNTCERLREKHIQLTIQRIEKLDEELERLEKMLELYIAKQPD